MRVFLIGFMSAGKTTLGRRVAERLGMPFFDLDSWVEQKAGKSIPEIFAEEGEASFRRRETRALDELIRREKRGVFATGGGTFTVEANRALIRNSGLSIWIDVPPATLMERARGGGGQGRPLFASAEQALELLEARRSAYAQADERVEFRGETPEEDAERLFALLADHIEIS